MGNVAVWQLHANYSSYLAWHAKTGVCFFLHSHPSHQIDLKLAVE